jgi:protein TonB
MIHPRGGIRGRGPFALSLIAHALLLAALAAMLAIAEPPAARPAEIRSSVDTARAIPEPPREPEPPLPEPAPEPPRETLVEEERAEEPPDLLDPLPVFREPDLAPVVPDRPVVRHRPPPPPVAVPAPAPIPKIRPVAVQLPRGPSRRAAPAPGNPPPIYPHTAVTRRIEGLVLLLVTVLPDGAVSEISVKRSSGHPLLDREAVRAVSRWSFSPALADGRNVVARVEVPIRFSLE